MYVNVCTVYLRKGLRRVEQHTINADVNYFRNMDTLFKLDLHHTLQCTL